MDSTTPVLSTVGKDHRPTRHPSTPRCGPGVRLQLLLFASLAQAAGSISAYATSAAPRSASKRRSCICRYAGIHGRSLDRLVGIGCDHLADPSGSCRRAEDVAGVAQHSAQPFGRAIPEVTLNVGSLRYGNLSGVGDRPDLPRTSRKRRL
jgi:hypothetical protein